MEWLEITKAIGELGILIVIAGLFLFFYYKDKNARDTEFKQLFNAVVNKGTHILTEDEDRLAKQIDESITSYMKDIVNTLQPSKCFLVRYHNGGKDMNGLSFLKLSVTNEAGAGGLAPVIQEYQNQFRSSIGGICHAIDKQGYVFVPNLEEITQSSSLKILPTRNIYPILFPDTQEKIGAHPMRIAVFNGLCPARRLPSLLGVLPRQTAPHSSRALPARKAPILLGVPPSEAIPAGP